MKIVIVNENDVPVGTKERNELASSDIYRVSALWLTNSKGQHLMAQRALSKKKNPGKWGPAVAGTVEEGETYETNIVKEIQEEIGIALPIERLRKGPHMRRENATNRYFSQWYFATVDKELDEFTYPEQEVMALKWFTEEELRQALSERPEDFIPSIEEWLEPVLAGSRS
jgi:isopentenyldiphosphate isomerase